MKKTRKLIVSLMFAFVLLLSSASPVMAADAFQDTLKKMNVIETMDGRKALLTDAFSRASKEVKEKLGKETVAGTTATMILLKDQQFVVTNVGDSRCYRFSEGRLEQAKRCMKVVFREGRALPGDYFLLCTDGVYDYCDRLEDKLQRMIDDRLTLSQGAEKPDIMKIY